MNPHPVSTPRSRWLAALGAAFPTALGAWLIASFCFFIGNDQKTTVLLQALDYFSTAAWVALLLLTLVNRFRGLRSRTLAGYSGLAVGIAASLVGASVQITGIASGAEASDYVWGSLVSINLVFLLSVTLLQVWRAPGWYDRVLRWSPRRRRAHNLALVRVPSDTLADGELLHLKRVAIDLDLANDQWDNYCAALRAEGWDVDEVSPLPDHPDSVFVEDMVIVVGTLAILTSPGAASRQGEQSSVEQAVRQLPGIRLARIDQPGTLDGGDILQVGSTVYVGASTRTNGEGIRQLKALLRPEGIRVIAVPVERSLHLKSAVTALPDGTVIGHPDLIDPALFDRFLAVPEPSGSAVVILNDDTLLIAASAPKTAQLLANLGYRVIAVDVSEFEKCEGGVTCLSVRVPGRTRRSLSE